MALISQQAPPRSGNHDVSTFRRGRPPGGPRVNSKAALGLSAGALVVGLLAGLALSGGDDKPSKATGPGPTKTVAGVPIGYERSQDGAARAALAYEGVLTGLPKVSPEARDAALKELASDARESEILDAAHKALSFYDQQFGQGAVLRTSVVGFRVVAYEPSKADVELWEVSVVGPRDAAPRSAWATRRLSLTWEGDWKLAAPHADGAGPTPAVDGTATDPAALITAARDLSEVRYAPPSN